MQAGQRKGNRVLQPNARLFDGIRNKSHTQRVQKEPLGGGKSMLEFGLNLNKNVILHVTQFTYEKEVIPIIQFITFTYVIYARKQRSTNGK